MKKFKRMLCIVSAFALAGSSPAMLSGCAGKHETVTLRVCSWEEYIDLGGWKDDELIDIDNPYSEGGIIGVNSMVEDFEEWFSYTYGYEVKVEYSTFGTNEDLYNRLSLGDEYDLVCPSDYMLMKLIADGNCVEYSDKFWDESVEENYYAKNVSRYIDGADGEGIFNYPEYDWHKKAACYMWGTTGLVYNPEKVEDIADVSTWAILLNENYSRQVTIKDNVRDAYFSALGIINSEALTNGGLSDSERSALLNAVDGETIEKAQGVLKYIKENVYSFETDSGKADMVTGKVVANLQWSGDAVFIIDEAENDGAGLWYSVPDECTNLWFDGWLMLKNGVEKDEKLKSAAEAFVNFLSRPDNAVRNMYYIGYSSAIADDTVFDYMEWNYGADGDAEEVFEYDVSYFFNEEKLLEVDAVNFEREDDGRINRGRQLFAQYPPENVIQRSVVMLDFGDKLSEINQMWINVRCLDIREVSPVTVGVTSAVIIALAGAVCLYKFRYNLFFIGRPKKGYEKVQ